MAKMRGNLHLTFNINLRSLILFFTLVILGVFIIVYIFFVNRNSDNTALPSLSTESQQLAVLSAQTSIPLYSSNNPDKYTFIEATQADETIVIATYRTEDGIINVTSQPKPSVDPFLRIEPVEKFTTSIGEAKLYPDNNGNPYIVIYAPLSWVIVRSGTEQNKISSDLLKAFSLSLRLPD